LPGEKRAAPRRKRVYLLHVVRESLVLVQQVLLQRGYILKDAMSSGEARRLGKIRRHDGTLRLREVACEVVRGEKILRVVGV
jgi:hypothetical protein